MVFVGHYLHKMWQKLTPLSNQWNCVDSMLSRFVCKYDFINPAQAQMKLYSSYVWVVILHIFCCYFLSRFQNKTIKEEESNLLLSPLSIHWQNMAVQFVGMVSTWDGMKSLHFYKGTTLWSVSVIFKQVVVIKYKL